MVILARESRGLTQHEAAIRLRVTQSRISKIESGMLPVPDDLVPQLSEVFEYPEEFFSQTGLIYPLGAGFYRKAKGIATRDLTVIIARINIERIRIQKLLRSIELDTVKLPTLEIDGERHRSPESVARAMRKFLSLPRGPIENLTRTLENAGVFVVQCDFETRFFSGVSIRTENGIYIVFVNSAMPGDRQRFTLAHELGHIIMHRIPNDEMENEADRFASEFLMPEQDIRSQLSNLTLAKLASLKKYWKVSMQAILMAATNLRLVNERKRRYLWMQMGKHGYRLNEPTELAIPRDPPTLLQETVKIHLGQLGYSETDLQEILFLGEDELEKYWLKAPKRLRLLRLDPTTHKTKGQSNWFEQQKGAHEERH